MRAKTAHVIIPTETIESKIFLIRGRKVMLDRHLAELYNVETRVLNQAVRRNLDRFPSDFMMTLTRNEIRNISQIVISLKHAPSVFAFTEQGISMLSSVLNSKMAIQVNIQIMRTFTKLRAMLASNEMLRRKIEELERKFKKHDEHFDVVFNAIKKLLAPPPAPLPPKRPIGFHS